jgi:O-antigen ligase
MLFTTGSRGALLSLVFSLIILLVRVTLSGFFFRLRLTPLSLIGASVVVSIIVLALASGSRFEKIDSFVIAAMQVNSKQRGLHSGLSGRTSLWSFTISRLTGLEWVFGRGFRQGFVIDSGYVTVLFDNGLFGVVAVVGSFLRQLWLLWRSTSTPDLSGWWLYRLALLWLTTEYLLSSVTERFLWSYGNQFSLLMMFMLMCSQRELIGRDTSRYNLPGVSRHELTNLRG